MKALLLLVFIVTAFSIKLGKNNHQLGVSSTMVGGYSKIDVSNLSTQEKQIDQYLASLKLSNAQTQVVAGYNYKYTYQGADSTSYEVVVYDKPWEANNNFRSITSVKRTKNYVNSLGQAVTAVKTVQSNTGTFSNAVSQLFQ